MKIVFKIIDNLPETEQIIVKYCRKNAPKPIDDYESYAISYRNLDFSDYQSLVNSISDCGIGIVDRQFEEEPCLESNIQKNSIETTNLNEIKNMVIENEYTESFPLNQINV